MRHRPLKSLPHGTLIGAKLTFPLKHPGGGTRMATIPVKARIVRGVVDDPFDPAHWATPYVGQTRLVIECIIKAPGIYELFFLDAEGDPHIFWKLTHGKGDPGLGGIRQLPISTLVYDPDIPAFYRLDYSGKSDTGGEQYRVVKGGVA